MIFAFVEDGTLEILDDEDAARLAYEGVVGGFSSLENLKDSLRASGVDVNQP
jgi:hypothetical protein